MNTIRSVFAGAAVSLIAAAIPARAESERDRFAICSQVSRAIDDPIDLAFSGDAAGDVWANAARLARALCRSTWRGDVLDCYATKTKATPEPKAPDQLVPSK